uniref:Uncharacterized protein n=1 Tax=Pipistrellus kuhlii TaxID=59472 RepID=A0A7J7Y9F5_PIPKU|nr:hypothetical protein mPipKuh1_010286 [Pipistrellus kuhlii]
MRAPGRRTRRPIVWGNQGYSGEDKHLAQSDPAGDGCCVIDRLLLRASISERHLAFTKFDSFHIAQSSWNLPVYNERTLGGGRSHSSARQKQDRNGAARGNPGKASPCQCPAPLPCESDAIWVC